MEKVNEASGKVKGTTLEELAERMGINIDKSSRPSAPPIEKHCSQFVRLWSKTISVNGHVRRSDTLYNAWYERFNINDDLKPIHLVDLAPEMDDPRHGYKNELDVPSGEFVVEVTDVSSLATARPNVVINYQIGAEEWGRPTGREEALKLLGSDWFFTDDEYFVDGFAESDKPNVAVIPNGNKEDFFNQINIQELYGLLRSAGGGVLSVVNDVEKETLLDYLQMASVVITTPSITAMECAMIGLPILLVRTSWDQNGRFVENGIGQWFSKEVLSFLLTNKSVRLAMAENGRKKIKNNIDDVIDTIYKKWKEWSDDNES